MVEGGHVEMGDAHKLLLLVLELRCSRERDWCRRAWVRGGRWWRGRRGRRWDGCNWQLAVTKPPIAADTVACDASGPAWCADLCWIEDPSHTFRLGTAAGLP